MSFSLKLFGGLALSDEHGPVTGQAAQRHRLALMAILAIAYPRAVSRDRLIGLLWADRDQEHARHLLNQAIHTLRRTLGQDAIRSVGDDVQLGVSVVACDVIAFQNAIGRDALEEAVRQYGGGLLDGFFLDAAPEFERWIAGERERFAAAFAAAVERLAGEADARGDTAAALRWWRARASHDPYDSRCAVALARAMDRGGNRAGALQHLLAHRDRLREDLEIEAPSVVLALVQDLRRASVQAATPSGELVPSSPPDAPRVSATGSPSPAPPTLGRRQRSLGHAAVVLVAFALIGALWVTSSRTDSSVSPQVADEIARAVTLELDRRARGDTVVRGAPRRTASIPAYELYLRGSDPALLRSDSGAREGLEHFQRALALDSMYAAAWSGLARLALRLAGTDRPNAERYEAMARDAAERAVQLDDSLAESHATLGLIHLDRRDVVQAERQFRRAIALDPRDARYREWLARLHLWMGRQAEALAETRQALLLAPLSPSATAEFARSLLAQERCDEALDALATLDQLDPPLLRVPIIKAQCYAQQRQWSEAIALMTRGTDDANPVALGMRAYLYARAGRTDDAVRTRAALIDLERDQGHASYLVALTYLASGDRDEAVRWLDRAVADGSLSPWSEPFPLTVALLHSMRDDPRISDIRRRLGLP